MAKLQVMTLTNLEQYDGLIKNYIDTADAKSLKTVAIDGNTLKFYKITEPVGETTPAYEITLPSTDISGLMAKLTGATVDNIVTVAENGEVKDSGVALTALATKAEVEAINNADTGILAQAKEYADGKDDAIAAAQTAGDNAQADVDALETLVGTIPEGYTATTVTAYAKELADAVAANGYDDTELKTSIGDLTTLKTTEKTSVVGAINEVADGKADKATTIAGYGITDAYTKTEVDSAITTAVANAEHLKRSIVTVLPEVADADVHTIYMVEITGGDGNQKYEEFMLINGTFEKIGDSAVDLTDYATKGYADQAEADAKTYADGLNTAMDTRVATVEGLIGEGYEPISSEEIANLFA